MPSGKFWGKVKQNISGFVDKASSEMKRRSTHEYKMDKARKEAELYAARAKVAKARFELDKHKPKQHSYKPLVDYNKRR
tara:strand:+ start:3782 stop:4018 length:237 start_codon:yes stop_codon:yes gene_type:complete